MFSSCLFCVFFFCTLELSNSGSNSSWFTEIPILGMLATDRLRSSMHCPHFPAASLPHSTSASPSFGPSLPHSALPSVLPPPLLVYPFWQGGQQSPHCMWESAYLPASAQAVYYSASQQPPPVDNMFCWRQDPIGLDWQTNSQPFWIYPIKFTQLSNIKYVLSIHG